MPKIVVRNGRDYTCDVETLPACDQEVAFDLVARDGEVRDTGRYTLRPHVDKMVEGKQVPVFRLAKRVGDVLKGANTVIAFEHSS